MSFVPKFSITNVLLANIKRISSLTQELNDRRFPHVVLIEYEKSARAVSAHASTSIEGNPLPLTEVKKILKSAPTHIRTSEKEVLQYNTALEFVNNELQKGNVQLSLEFILHTQKQITEGLLPAHQSGKLRKHPVVVNDPKSGHIVFLPPDASDVPPMIAELISFLHENTSSIDPLILAGIFHKQFVLIHPFIDGNGRTTRLVTKTLLAAMGLNTFNLFSFENYYNKNVTRYFQTVGEYGNYYELSASIDFTAWLEYFTEGIIDELLRVEQLLPKEFESPSTQLKPHHELILKRIQENGFTTDKDYAELTDRAKATRTLDFKKLLNLGKIDRKGKGKGTYYILPETRP